ncbi:hypothetical protein GCM10012279_33750 [Micromonospora yangpuensis]|nr:hypothetical protein GCM10012279_33750 [Micromonospora yangpuensis]
MGVGERTWKQSALCQVFRTKGVAVCRWIDDGFTRSYQGTECGTGVPSMSWFLLAFERRGDALVSEVRMPQLIDDDVVAGYVGWHPNLRGDSFPISGIHLLGLMASCLLVWDEDNCEYFLEFRAG